MVSSHMRTETGRPRVIFEGPALIRHALRMWWQHDALAIPDHSQ